MTWIIKRESTNSYFGPYEWERTLARAVRFKTRAWALENAAHAATTNTGVRVVRVVDAKEDAAFALCTVLRDVRACLPGAVPEHLIAEIDMLIPRPTGQVSDGQVKS